MQNVEELSLNLGNKLREVRKSKKLSLSKAETDLISRDIIYRMEHNLNNTSISNLVQYANSLGLLVSIKLVNPNNVELSGE